MFDCRNEWICKLACDALTLLALDKVSNGNIQLY